MRDQVDRNCIDVRPICALVGETGDEARDIKQGAKRRHDAAADVTSAFGGEDHRHVTGARAQHLGEKADRFNSQRIMRGGMRGDSRRSRSRSAERFINPEQPCAGNQILPTRLQAPQFAQGLGRFAWHYRKRMAAFAWRSGPTAPARDKRADAKSCPRRNDNARAVLVRPFAPAHKICAGEMRQRPCHSFKIVSQREGGHAKRLGQSRPFHAPGKIGQLHRVAVHGTGQSNRRARRFYGSLCDHIGEQRFEDGKFALSRVWTRGDASAARNAMRAFVPPISASKSSCILSGPVQRSQEGIAPEIDVLLLDVRHQTVPPGSAFL